MSGLLDSDAERPQQGKIVRVDVRGADAGKWAQFRGKLLERMHTILQATIDAEEGTTVADEARRFTSHMLDYARNRLQREGLENDRIEAEIAKLYAERRKDFAEADLHHAEAAAIRRRTALQELCQTLVMTKVFLTGDTGEESLLFGQQISEFLAMVKEMGLLDA